MVAVLWLILPALKDVKPYRTADKDKKQEVELMFDNISRRYDLLNRLLSLGIDVGWRKKALNMLKPFAPTRILDIATGTGDMAFMADRILQPREIVGLDLSAGMLEVARKRSGTKDKTGPAEITFTKGDAENLEFPDGAFSAATVAFGVRNFGDLQAGLKEIHRVLQPGAPFVVLEFTRPRTFPVKQLFQIYFRHILPLIGAWTSGDKRAYTYLFESVQAFPDYERFTAELERAGFVRTAFKPLSLGICAIYIGFRS